MTKNLFINQWSKLRESVQFDELGNEVGKLEAFESCHFDFSAVQNFRSWDCLTLDIYLPDERPIEVEVDIFPLSIGRKEFIEKTSAKVSLQGKGWKQVQIAFSQFDYLKAVGAFWSFISGIELCYKFLSEKQTGTVLLKNIRLQKAGTVSVSSSVYSRAGRAGEYVTYEIEIENLVNEAQMVTVSQDLYGKESMKSTIEPHLFCLQPYEITKCKFTVEINEQIAPGGFETQKLTITPNGNANAARKIEFITGRELPHPYIMHTEKGWIEVKDKVEQYGWAKNRLEEYIQKAESWKIPEPNEKEYLFETGERNNIMASAISWRLTENLDFAEKAAIFLRKLADSDKGYESIETPLFKFIESYSEYEKGCPMMHMACNQGLVQEAEFFRDMAMSYDLIYDAGVLSREDHINIERAFRSYIDFADYLLTDGDGNNFQLCEMTAGLFCSMALQDHKWMNRFIYSYNGFTDLIGSVILDDGWYFEVATGYISLAAEILSETVQAALPWGINLKDLYVAPSYHRNIMLSPWSMKQDKPFLGMSFERYGTSETNFRTLKQFYDSMLPFVDHRGVMFGMNDGTEKHYHELYEMAYFLFRDERYIPIIRSNPKRRNILYGVAELPDVPNKEKLPSAFADHAGFAVLRSQKDLRIQNEQIQAVVKYGSHGGYHGHFDRLSLLSLMRYGRSFYNPEATWYGYASYLFKMWVQASLSHNMVVVDQKMQQPSEAKRLLFHSGNLFQACAVEVNSRWSDPPYGGQTPYLRVFPEEKGWDEGRSIPTPENKRKQGDIGDYTEKILQRRIMIVTDDYVILRDFVQGEEAHEFDCLFHIKGFNGIEAENVILQRHTGQFNQDPYGAGQFITNCDWYDVHSPAVLHFVDKPENKSEPTLNIDIHRVWPKQGEVMVGNFPENKEVNKKVSYEVLGDGEVIDSGQSGIWILGKKTIEVDVKGINELELRCFIENNAGKLKTLFIGDSYFISSTGDKVDLSELKISFYNVDEGEGIGGNYYGDPVVIEGNRYEKAIPFEPIIPGKPSCLKVNLIDLDFHKFVGIIGGDYPVDHQHRKTVSFRTHGNSAYYTTVIEPYKEKKMIKYIETLDKDIFVVELNNGKKHEVKVKNLDQNHDDLFVEITESFKGTVTQTEGIQYENRSNSKSTFSL
jgi:hypothetical protein